MNMPVVRFQNVSKSYSLYKKKSDQLLEIFKLSKSRKNFTSLSDISFEVFKGETIGIIGINGSGKSTLSSLLAQVTTPSSGDIWIDGEPSLVAISAGLNNHLTGLENIELKCLMHGLKIEEIEEIKPDIIEFADIGDFINQPIKSYSSGMKSRLGFAISVHIQPDILIVDEALSVGDTTFYNKCLNKFDEFKQEGKTIFFISHSLSQVNLISDKILWLHFGRIMKFDKNELVVKEYNKFINWFNSLNKQQKKEYRKRMLNTQIHKSNEIINNKKLKRRAGTKNKRGNTVLFALQFSLIILFFLTSTLIMVVDIPVSAIKGNIESVVKGNHQTSELIDDGEAPFIEIDKTGYINEHKAIIYKDETLEQVLLEVPFSTKINIIGKISDSAYKVRFDKYDGFISQEEVEIQDENVDIEKNITVEDFLPVFPEQFKRSYLFFFTFLDTKYDEISDSLSGKSGEKTDEFGRKVLQYDDISYIFNDNERAVAIQVNNVLINDEFISKVVDDSILSSRDSELHYFKTESYGICVDLEDQSITFLLN